MSISREVSDRGIIWRLAPYSEQDALITIFSEHGGKLRLLAKGLRGQKSKRKGTLRPFALISFERIVPRHGSGLAQLTRSEFQRAPDISDPLVWSQLSFMAEISDHLLAAGQEMPGVFALWENLLRLNFRKPYLELCGFLVQLLSQVGFFPDLQKCRHCGQKFTAAKEIFWDQESGLFCCSSSGLDVSLTIPLTFSELKSLFFWQHTAPANFAQLALTAEETKRLYQLLFQKIRALEERPFKAQQVFEGLAKK